MRLKFVFVLLLPILFFPACKDTDQVGSSIQPDEDLLRVHSNKVYVETASMLVDSALSKSSNLFLGEFSDSRLGRTQVEFMSQLDARLGSGGLTIPDTSVISTSSAITNGILNTLLQQRNSDYGLIKEVFSPHDLKVDSVVFVIQYSTFFGDTLKEELTKGVKVFALNKTLEPSINYQYYTNTDVSGFCKQDTLLGEKAYLVGGQKELRIKLDNKFGERLAKIYQDGSIDTQEAFNNFFKGIYVTNFFNGGHIMQIEVTGVMIYYSYHASIATSYKGESKVFSSNELEEELGFNPLQSSFFLSANRAVERVNLVRHAGLEENFPSLQNQNETYMFTPAGMYTAVNIPFQTMVDSIRKPKDGNNVEVDTAKVMFNSARLILYAKKSLDWETELNALPNRFVLLIHKDSVIPFFHKNKFPDEISSFFAEYDTEKESYTFNITRAAQMKLAGKSSFDENMVVVPIVREVLENTYYYRQQFWLTATMLYGINAEEAKRPRIDMIYTERK